MANGHPSDVCRLFLSCRQFVSCLPSPDEFLGLGKTQSLLASTHSTSWQQYTCGFVQTSQDVQVWQDLPESSCRAVIFWKAKDSYKMLDVSSGQWFEMEKNQKTPNQLRKKITVRPSNCCGSWRAFLWCRETPSAASGIIIRFCRSSWPFSPAHSLCCVWYILSLPGLPLFSVSPVCCFPLTASAAGSGISCESLVKRYLNLPRQIAREWVHFAICSQPSFSQAPLFLQSSESRSALFPVNTDSVLQSHSYSCCALLLWLQLINSWINSRQWRLSEKSIASHIPTLLRHKLK